VFLPWNVIYVFCRKRLQFLTKLLPAALRRYKESDVSFRRKGSTREQFYCLHKSTILLLTLEHNSTAYTRTQFYCLHKSTILLPTTASNTKRMIVYSVLYTETIFPHLQSLQTGCGAHPAAYSMCTAVLYRGLGGGQGVKGPGCDISRAHIHSQNVSLRSRGYVWIITGDKVCVHKEIGSLINQWLVYIMAFFWVSLPYIYDAIYLME
jgi:hypothetical protein